MLIDCHVHLNNYHTGQAIPTEQHYKELLEKMDERGVHHAVVLTSYRVSADRPGVEEIIRQIDKNPRMTVVEGLRWRGENQTDLFAMEERIRDGLVRGIKLYPGYEAYSITDPSLETVFRIAAKHDVPVMIHTGDTFSKAAKVRNAHPLLVDDIAVDYPDNKFIMCLKSILVWKTNISKEKNIMLRWVIALLVIALLAAILGFGGVAGAAAGIAKIVFVIFLALAVLSFIFGRTRGV
jgi:uncharacterized membrane protein YtjA (UPF0391 family)